MTSKGPRNDSLNRGESMSAWVNDTFIPKVRAFSFATRRAWTLLSHATTRACGCACLIASAIHPLPVPTSSTSAGRRSGIALNATSTSSSVSLRGNQHIRGHFQLEPSKTGLLQDILQRLVLYTSVDSFFQPLHVLCTDCFLGKSQQLCGGNPQHSLQQPPGSSGGVRDSGLL